VGKFEGSSVAFYLLPFGDVEPDQWDEIFHSFEDDKRPELAPRPMFLYSILSVETRSLTA